jgi:hypothetical protein
MVGGIVMGAVLVAVVVGFWLTRNAKRGPTPGDAETRTIDFVSRYGPTGEPMRPLDDDAERE